MSGRPKHLIWTALLLVGCEPTEDVRVQPLPPLDRPSPEARAGLPEVAGVWRFAGWELAEGDSAGLAAELPGLGQLWLETQRLDSIAGYYVAGEGRVPLVGEVRRDSVVSLAALLGGGEGAFLAGRVSADTLWVSLTSLLEPGTWRSESRAAFVRSQVASPFVRLHGAPVLAAVTDTAGAALAGALGDSAAVAPGPAAPGATTPRPTAPGATPAAPPTRVGEAAPARPQAPAQPRPQQQAPPAQRQEPVRAPEPSVTRPPARPRLLGEPVRPDTARDTTDYSPTAARATSRPVSVSARR